MYENVCINLDFYHKEFHNFNEKGTSSLRCCIRLAYGSRKKSYFLSGPNTKALTPPHPLELSGHPFFSEPFFRASKKLIFFSGPASTPLL